MKSSGRFLAFRWRYTGIPDRRGDVKGGLRNSQVPHPSSLPQMCSPASSQTPRHRIHDSGLRYSATDHSQALRITRELMRLDQGFAQAVRTGLSMNEAVPGGGPITRTAETVKKA